MKQCISKVAVLAFVLALAVSSDALAKGRKTLTIYEKARVNDVVLEPGDYKVEVAENGNAADVMIYKGKQLVAKAAAQPEKLEKKAERNSVRFALEGDKAPEDHRTSVVGRFAIVQTRRRNPGEPKREVTARPDSAVVAALDGRSTRVLLEAMDDNDIRIEELF